MIDGLLILDRMERAVEKVRERLLRVTALLEAAQVDYAVAGGNAVAAWVATVDEAAVRNTRDVDLLVRQADIERMKGVLEPEGFQYRHVAGVDMFIDRGERSAREAVHLVLAKFRTEAGFELPDVDQAVRFGTFRVLSLEALVKTKLIANRRKDQVHLQDMISLGLIDATWPDRFQPELAARLKAVLDDPEG
jgi:hypothetical protein